jgi:glucose uptake protein
MILPTSYETALLLTFLTMLCWGSWANTTKMTGKWRFELYYFDYAFGVLLAATVLALTFGEMGTELSFRDNLMIARKLSLAFGFAAGVVFNLANMLLVAAISLAGMAVAFPIGIGLALVIGVVWSYALNPQGNPYLLFSGAALLVTGIVLTSRAYRIHSSAKEAHTARNPKRKHDEAPRTPTRAIALSLACGVLMGSFYPLVEMSKQDELGLRAYSVGFIFALGVFLSTPVFNIVFMNVPVAGDPVRLYDYFTGSLRQHLLGVAGGVIWAVGTVANFAAASAPKEVQVGPAISYAIGQGAVLVSTLWGLLYWKEFAGAERRVLRLIGLMIAAFVVGLGLISVAPLFATGAVR